MNNTISWYLNEKSEWKTNENQSLIQQLLADVTELLYKLNRKNSQCISSKKKKNKK